MPNIHTLDYDTAQVSANLCICDPFLVREDIWCSNTRIFPICDQFSGALCGILPYATANVRADYMRAKKSHTFRICQLCFGCICANIFVTPVGSVEGTKLTIYMIRSLGILLTISSLEDYGTTSINNLSPTSVTPPPPASTSQVTAITDNESKCLSNM